MVSPLHPFPEQPIPAQRAGIGLRAPHYRDLLESPPDVGWLEAHSENYLGAGPARATLERARRDFPLSLHGVGLSLGGDEPPDAAHLARLCDLVARIQPALVSEHVAWCSAGGVYLNDLLPMPYTEEALDALARNVAIVQDALARPILVENPAAYLAFAESAIPEWEFIVELAARTGCGLLLDVNNIYVSACNLGFAPGDYLAAVPPGIVGEIHLAGHQVNRLDDGRAIYIDDHGSAVAGRVWALFAEAAAKFDRAPVLIEWDTRIPSLDVLVAEAHEADARAARARTQARRAGAA